MREKDLKKRRRQTFLLGRKEHLKQEILKLLGIYRDLAKEGAVRGEGKEEIFQEVKEAFQMQAEEREELVRDTGEKLQNTIDFLELAFAEGQELVVFVTELTPTLTVWNLSARMAATAIINITKNSFSTRSREKSWKNWKISKKNFKGGKSMKKGKYEEAVRHVPFISMMKNMKPICAT